MIYLILFFEFLLIGSFAIGGGLATIPFLINLIDKYQWFSFTTLMDMIAVSESTPGPIGINMATYVGYLVSGVLGSLIASFAVFLPGFIFMLFIGKSYEKYKTHPIVKKIFYGIRPTITALIGFAAYTMLVSVISNMGTNVTSILSTLLIIGVTLIGSRKYQIAPIVLIIAAAISSLFLKL